MPQALSPTTLLTTKLRFIAVLIAIVVAVLLAEWRMTPEAAQHAAVMQPILFSHKHHVGDIDIDGRYCHTSVENSPFAGTPTTQICLTLPTSITAFTSLPNVVPDRTRRSLICTTTNVNC